MSDPTRVCTCPPPTEPDFPPYVRPLLSGMTSHARSCPVVAHLTPTPKEQREWDEWLDDYQDTMRRAWHSAKDYVIG